jgi:hypothetical protein
MMTYAWVVIRLLLFTVPVVATVYTYWTRTPQYALLHALTTEPQSSQLPMSNGDKTKTAFAVSLPRPSPMRPPCS